MVLIFVLVAFSCVGFSAGVKKEKHCYGKNLALPFTYSPQIYKGPIYFTPRGGGRAGRKTIMNNGQSNYPRLKADQLSVTLTDLRETDDGIYSVSVGENDVRDIIDLKVLECAEDIDRTYWQSFSIDVPREAQYLEFISLHGQTDVLWNRTGSQVKKDKVRMKRNVIDIFHLTQANNGYYNLRKNDHTLLRRKKLEVEANQLNHDTVENEYVSIQFPFASSVWTVTYTPDGDSEEYTLIDNGDTVRESLMYFPLKRRFYKLDHSFEISPAERRDSGYFYFKDQDGNLAQIVKLDVLYGYLPTYVYIIVPVLIILVLIGCCCCVKKCCCKKSSSKRTESAPAVQYQNRTQPSATYNAAPTQISYQPSRPVAPAGPAPPFSTGPPPTASPAGFSAQPNFLSTDVDPTFELKGSNFPSAPLLSSDSSSPCVYTSDKLNFL